MNYLVGYMFYISFAFIDSILHYIVYFIHENFGLLFFVPQLVYALLTDYHINYQIDDLKYLIYIFIINLIFYTILYLLFYPELVFYINRTAYGIINVAEIIIRNWLIRQIIKMTLKKSQKTHNRVLMRF